MESDDMDMNYIEAHHIVDRYVQGTLAEAERDAFEIFMLENPSIVDDVELARSYQSELRSQGNDLAPEARSGEGGAQVAAFWRPLAVAASVMLAISIGTQVLDQSSLPIPNSTNPPPRGVELRLEPLRSNVDREVAYEREAALILEVDVSGIDAETFSLDLRSDTGDFRHQVDGLVPREGFIRLRSTDLPFGDYSLAVTNSNSSPAEIVYQFTLVAKAERP